MVEAPEYRPGTPEILSIEDFDQAVRTAAGTAESGDVVLLSPASAACDVFQNFMVRGCHFKDLVRSL